MGSRRILVLFAHPTPRRSEVVRPLAERAGAHRAVTLVDLYAEYPDYRIDVDREQARLREHQVILFLFPLFWYSTPSLLKEWQDLVLEYGFAYGSGGRALEGKYFLCALSAGGPASAYSASGYNHYPLWELLRPLEQTARLCHLHYLPPFALFGARTALEEGRLGHHLLLFNTLLDALADDNLQPWMQAHAGTSNTLLAAPAAESAESPQ